MNVYKNLIIGLLLFGATVAHCDDDQPSRVENSYGYWAIGAGIPTFVSAKFGYRSQVDHHGYEVGVGVTPLVVVLGVHAFGSYLYYPKPHATSQSYIGLGLRAGGIINGKDSFGYIAPGLIVGKEYVKSDNSRRFIQVAIGPGGLTTEGLKYWTSISLAFGFAF